MKAIIAQDFAPLDKLTYGDWPDPVAMEGQVVIQAEALGVNYPDGLLVQGLYQARPPTPFIPGSEIAGRVIALGKGVSNFKVGDRVAARIFTGGYAEKAAASAKWLMPMPDAMTAEDACALLISYGTSHHALRQRAQIQAGETLCVLGAAGATGIAAVQIGKAIGARVIGVASTAAKRDIAKKAGADLVLGYENLKDALRRATDGKGVDVAYDSVGGEAFDALSRSMAWNGRLLIIGFASGTIPKFSVNLALLKSYSVVGVVWGSSMEKQPQVHSDNMKELVRWYLDGKVRPWIEGVYKLSEASDVLKRILGRGSVGKLILKP